MLHLQSRSRERRKQLLIFLFSSYFPILFTLGPGPRGHHQQLQGESSLNLWFSLETLSQMYPEI